MSQKFDLKPVFKAVNPEEAISFFRQKGFKIGFDYRDVGQQEDQAGFTVAKAMQLDLLTEIRGFVDAALANGTTLATFQKELMPRLVGRGWWGKQEMIDPVTGDTVLAQLGSPRRLEVIFDTNLATAYSEGQWERIQRNKELFPFLEYVRSASVNPRHTHLAYAGLVLRADDAFWQSHLPIKEWGCKCSVIQHTQRMLDREGLKVGKAPPEVMRSLVNKRTGEVMRVPTGVDPAFNYPPGGRLANLEKMLADKQLAANAGKAQRAAHNMMNARSETKVHRFDMPTQVLQRVAENTGFNVAGYKATFDNSSVGHVMNRHGIGNEKDKNQLPMTLNDFSYEVYVMSAPDLIEPTHKTDSGLDAVLFSKVIGGNNYVIVKELRTRRKHLATTTMYIKKGVPE